MNESKRYLAAVGLAFLYLATVFACAFIGFLAPVCWVGFPVVAALLAAFSYYGAAKRWKRFGVGTLCSFFVAIFLLGVGEIRLADASVILIMGIVSDAVRQRVGNTTKRGITIAYPLLAIGNVGYILSLWTRTDWYFQGAYTELGLDYARGLMAFANVWALILLIVIIAIVGYIGIRIAVKCMK